MSCWRSLLLVYEQIDVTLSRKTRFIHSLAPREIEHAVESFQSFPSLVAELTNEEASVEPEILHCSRPLTRLTEWSDGFWWPGPEDVASELCKHAPPGRFDSIFVLWPQNNFRQGTTIPSGGWGLGIGASSGTQGATYAAVGNAEEWVWEIPRRGEVWLHEWLHGVCAFFRSRGYEMPDGDADGGDRHGYTRSEQSGWTGYYRDLMTGCVIEEGRGKGIPLSAWRTAPPVSGAKCSAGNERGLRFRSP